MATLSRVLAALALQEAMKPSRPAAKKKRGRPRKFYTLLTGTSRPKREQAGQPARYDEESLAWYCGELDRIKDEAFEASGKKLSDSGAIVIHATRHFQEWLRANRPKASVDSGLSLEMKKRGKQSLSDAAIDKKAKKIAKAQLERVKKAVSRYRRSVRQKN